MYTWQSSGHLVILRPSSLSPFSVLAFLASVDFCVIIYVFSSSQPNTWCFLPSSIHISSCLSFFLPVSLFSRNSIIIIWCCLQAISRPSLSSSTSLELQLQTILWTSWKWPKCNSSGWQIYFFEMSHQTSNRWDGKCQEWYSLFLTSLSFAVICLIKCLLFTNPFIDSGRKLRHRCAWQRHSWLQVLPKTNKREKNK